MPDRVYSPSLKWIGITKVIWTHFRSKKLFHIRCNIIFNFEHLRARACIFLWWIETELSFLNSSWNEDDLSPYVILNTLSCKEFILLLKPLLRNIQTKGQYPNWDVNKCFHNCLPFSRHMYEATLANVLSFWLAFLQSLSMWSLKWIFKRCNKNNNNNNPTLHN